ncbi:MAG: hypothetical protein R6V67_07195 [Spirochaetia bacterium]
MAHRKTVVILSVTAGILAVLIIISTVIINVINGKVEDEITAQIDSAIDAEGLDQNFSYGEVQASVARGRIGLTDVRFSSPMGDSDMQADNIRLAVPVTEAIAFVQNPDSASLSKLQLSGEQMTLTNPQTGNKTETGAFQFDIEGELDRSLLDVPLSVLMEKVSGIQVKLNDSKFTPGSQFITQMQMFPGAATLVSDGAFDIKTMNIGADISPEEVILNTFDLDSGLMSFDGIADIGFNGRAEPKNFSGEFSIDKLHSDMRGSVAPFFQQIGQPIPSEGSFDLSFDFSESGSPEITVE